MVATESESRHQSACTTDQNQILTVVGLRFVYAGSWVHFDSHLQVGLFMLSPSFLHRVCSQKVMLHLLKPPPAHLHPLETSNISFGLLLVPQHPLFHLPSHKTKRQRPVSAGRHCVLCPLKH